MKGSDNHMQGTKSDKQHSIISNKCNCQLCVDESQMYLYSWLLGFPFLTVNTLILGRVSGLLLCPSSFLLFLKKV